jgi:hypothetical protein
MGLNNEKVMDMGQPVVAAVAGVLSAVAVGATYTPTDFLGTGDLVGGKIISAPWGREIDFVLSGAGTNQVDIYGRDYLGQPVHKTLAGNGATRVPTGVALKWLDRIVALLVVVSLSQWGTPTGLALSIAPSLSSLSSQT